MSASRLLSRPAAGFRLGNPGSLLRPSSMNACGSQRFFRKEALRPPAPFAFAFDIDGVLLHESRPIPGATQTLRHLQSHNVPFILLTNGGGKHETDRVADLSDKLGVPLSVDNFVQSHTPFQQLVDGLRDRHILVTGSDAHKIRAIAERYGFGNVVTPADIIVGQPTIWPFEPLMESVYARTARPLPKGDLKIDAIFVFNDPRDWALDIQIIVDLLLSDKGVLGTYSPKNGRAELPNRGWQSDGQPPLFFSNPDLFWSAAHHLPRFGQGAFQGALRGVWREVTGGGDLQCRVIGKPHTYTYEYAERVLNEHRLALLGQDGQDSGVSPLQRVYMVGDNPESDIRGANEYSSSDGARWRSMLVRTGVWNPDRGEPAHTPDFIVDDVSAAVNRALKEEGWAGF